MIADKDRSWWFGASDTAMIMGNWETATFKKWWLEKLALRTSTLSTKPMKVGSAFEHKILETVPGVTMDRQILIPELHLRVNYDGDDCRTIYEVKTHKSEKFRLSKAYRAQAQVEMFAYVKQLKILAYRLTDEDYANYFRPIDPARLQEIPVAYDEAFIKQYLPRNEYLGWCMEEGRMPDAKHFAK